ncbi:proteoglycan 4-like [Penaeus indicus]|uniref:proteoglycan 4-like n=1 Tax=Penaeus indicus TaxID=29960 RepID=UPI00300D8590
MRKGSSFWCTVASLAVLLLAFSDSVAGDDEIVMGIQQELKHIDDSLDELLLLVNPETTTVLPSSTVSSDEPASPGSSVGSSVQSSTTLASVGSSAQSSSTQEPAESSTTQKPAESSTTQEPAESSTTQEPAESSTTQEPAESSTTQEPAESSTTQEPTKSSAPTTKPKESFEENQSSSSEQPQPSSSEQPQPSSSEQPQPSSSEQPQPSSSEQPQPSSSEQPQPSSSEQPQPSSSEQPQPSSSEQPQSSSSEPTSTVPPIPVCITNGTDDEDLCLRLTSVLDDIEAVTRTVADGTMGQSELDELRNCSTRLDDVIEDMRNHTDFIASSVDVEALTSRKDALDQVLTEAEEAVAAVLSPDDDEYDPTLAIVLGTLGGLVAVGIIGYVGFAFYKKNKAKKARLNDNPMRNMEGGSGQDNSAFAGSSSRLN